MKAAQYTYKDARDLVVLAVGYAYLQAIADEARIETAEAQVKTAQALYRSGVGSGQRRDVASDRCAARASGTANPPAAIDSGEERFRDSEADLARVIGLAPGQEFELTDKSPYAAVRRDSPWKKR